jgi:uncharacterized protein YjbI with pentapeptide repeats
VFSANIEKEMIMNTQLEEILSRLHTTKKRATLHAVKELRDRGWLTDGSLQGVALCKALLINANLENANLCCAGLHQADLQWANLSSTNLRGAKLSLCNLSGSNMKNAKLDNADLYKANLRGVQNLTDEQLRKVSRLCGAILPDGERYDGRYSLFGDLALAEWNNVCTSDPDAMAEFYGVSIDVYIREQHEKVPG